ncbi:hypothetical protein MLD38_036792 [Melastoma candidum]|uniref:Uncharacterized protein n=1 Tax=Melastoma candidum TaxID=119954 RepID=A0ACB9LLG7_9MYRT|nr:hypothetical protein MLD38_036792 [Melastoma candidum]
MSQVVVLNAGTLLRTNPSLPTSRGSTPCPSARRERSWTQLQRQLKCNGRFSCLFSGNGREDQARKALESALGGKKNEFEKWDKEIKRREEEGGGGSAGGGRGWFGWGGQFGWSDDGNFWPEAQQTSLTVLGIVLLYLLIAKGDLILAMVLNPLLFTLRGMRSGLTVLTSKISRVSPQLDVGFDPFGKSEVRGKSSAKEEVLRKWGSD